MWDFLNGDDLRREPEWAPHPHTSPDRFSPRFDPAWVEPETAPEREPLPYETHGTTPFRLDWTEVVVGDEPTRNKALISVLTFPDGGAIRSLRSAS